MSSPRRAPAIVAKAIVAKAIVAKSVAKSAPKSAAKTSGKPASKARTPLRPVAATPAGDISAEAKRIAAQLQGSVVSGKLDQVSAEALQALIAAACRLYTARSEAGEQFAPVPKNSISATDVMVVASGLLRAADLAVFELGMWQNWTGR
jgi:hypothetical protein